ncbi:GGDEF domain-containing protein [Paraneptunicella aestuarii]|uniref:GGDEF domain-containing protein n=1 Tax=Paraneptunicella aestuarii TaxID=2831148 RepID=UPI001E423BEB|nr:GGDEF domain-containing protein [Paraneptunicella aestuarii]UAA39271.1 GGDEF domain-containing protein [Paraneptunicella aestuarii]
MSKNDLEKSFNILKKTVPLMLKHKMPAIPTNYALWYTYAANETPSLNESMDGILAQISTLSNARAEEMYRNYVADKQEVSPWQLRQNIEAMLLEISQTVQDTKSDTHVFRSAMDGCLDDLEKVEKEGWSVEEVMGLVRNLVNDAQEIRRSTLNFSAALTSAEKEIAQLRAELQQTQKHALYDSLTGLCNRRFFDDELQSMMHHTPLCLIIVDVDHFKKFNDTHGHVMGDKVLKAVAKKLQQSCRDGAQAYRFGGEEFAILIPTDNITRALHVAEVMRRSIEKIQLKDKRTGQTIGGITASFGVSQADEKMQISDFIETADKHLYEAKNLGRNRVMPMH